MTIEFELPIINPVKGESLTPKDFGAFRPLYAYVVEPYSKGRESTVRMAFSSDSCAYWFLRSQCFTEGDTQFILATRAIEQKNYW